MTFKRSLLVLMWLTLVPAVAMAQPEGPSVTPAEGTANVIIDSFFLDGNDEEGVIFTLQCTSGSYSPASVTYAPGETYPGEDLGLGGGGPGYYAHLFVVADIPEGAPNVCTVFQTITDAYYNVVDCQGDGDPSPDCEGFTGETDVCTFENVQEGDVAVCLNDNEVAPVDVEVTKIWEMAGAAQSDIDTDVRITLYCDAEIVNGTRESKNVWKKNKKITEYLDADGVYDGVGSTTFGVIPDWYPTRNNPENQRYTECWADENVKTSAVEVDNDCDKLQLSPGAGDSCTITNTVFFEGIPTLSQYGMVIMALLMLGVGFIGMRRFV